MYKRRLGGCVEGAMAHHGYVETDPNGRYGRLKEILGKGATKTVYRAFDEVLGMEVAWNQVKLNQVFRSPEELQRLYSEVHLLSTLNHDSIIRFYTSWIDVNRRTFNFITEMLTSGTLREYRKRYKRVDILAIKNWACQILHGLVYLHGHDPPVIHRDLKCDNIFVNGHLGQVKIGDLGLAAFVRGSQPAHSVIGTPEFMAPELYEEEYNELVDIYSFGMCVLEMLTSEYPYSECSNPAQIYKKVTSGKLPSAFYRIHDREARRFVGKCLETASKRLPAKELLLDPFLALDDVELLPIPMTETHQPFPDDMAPEGPKCVTFDQTRSSDVTITGKMNPEDDTIYLKVQIADKGGCIRNIYFPFDIVSDTPMDVATEMVKELDIIDREPLEIAQVIESEISSLIPYWKEWDPTQHHHQHHSFCYQDVEEDWPHRSPHSCSSSQASLSGLTTSSGTHCCDWLQDNLFLDDDDASSQSSFHSYSHSNLNYNSGSEHDYALSPREKNPTGKLHKSTRFCPKTHVQGANYPDRSDVLLGFRESSSLNCRRLTRNRSLVDTCSQLLHRSLVAEVNKRRMFKTVGAVENIGFHEPQELSGQVSQRRGSTCSMRTPRDGKKRELKQ